MIGKNAHIRFIDIFEGSLIHASLTKILEKFNKKLFELQICPKIYLTDDIGGKTIGLGMPSKCVKYASKMYSNIKYNYKISTKTIRHKQNRQQHIREKHTRLNNSTKNIRQNKVRSKLFDQK